MTRWIEDPSLEAPDGHRWMRPAPDDCPNCPCHTARVCSGGLWAQASRPANPDGSPYTDRCPCEVQATARAVLRDAMAQMHAEAGPPPECCGHITCTGDKPCGYVLAAMLSDSPRCECIGGGAT